MIGIMSHLYGHRTPFTQALRTNGQKIGHVLCFLADRAGATRAAIRLEVPCRDKF